jgi:hypothetical protein
MASWPRSIIYPAASVGRFFCPSHREQLGGRRVRLNDDQRRRLAAKAKGLGRKLLAEVATIVTPDTLLAWHRKLIARAPIATAPRGIQSRVLAHIPIPAFPRRFRSAAALRASYISSGTCLRSSGSASGFPSCSYWARAISLYSCTRKTSPREKACNGVLVFSLPSPALSMRISPRL